MITTGYAQQAGIAQETWNDPNALKQYAGPIATPQNIGDRLNDHLSRLHKIESTLANINDRIYGSMPRGVSVSGKDQSGNHLAVLAEMTETIARCEEEIQRLERGI